MIVRTASGYKVVGTHGKNLSSPDLTYGEAVKRLARVEQFAREAAEKKKKKGK